jgi:endoglucanase
MSRKGGSILDFENSSFWYGMRIWISEDPFIMYFGVLSTIINLIIGIKNFAARVAGMLTLLFWIFLMRGGLVIEFYIVPIIPLLALNIALLGWYMQKFLSRISYIRVFRNVPALALCVGVIISSLHFSTNVRDTLNLYTSDQITPQVKAVDWILSRETPNTFMIVDNYSYIDLQERKKDKTFRTEWYWKVDKDPDVRNDMIHSDINNVDYVALTPQMKNDIAYSGLGMTLAAWKNSRPITIFSNDYWDVDVWGSVNPKRILKASWESYKREFIQEGRVIDPGQNNATTSEGQSYALLRAVWQDDKKTFDEVYTWTKQYLRQGNGLYFWKWEGSTESGKVIDQSNATDADQDISLALLFAYKRWGGDTYKKDALEGLESLWANNVVTLNKKPYMVAGIWANAKNEIIINPSYLSPASYRIFAQADPGRSWIRLVDTSYEVLQGCTTAKLDQNKGVLPPEWCALDKTTNKFTQVQSADSKATEYGYNAFRIPWRITLDYQWNKDARARNYLSQLTVLGKEYTEKKKLATAYKHNGDVWEDYESVAAYGGNIGYFMMTNKKQADNIYKEKMLKKFYEDKDRSYWDDSKNYYTQNWGWFGTALYTNQLQNLWIESPNVRITRK